MKNVKQQIILIFESSMDPYLEINSIRSSMYAEIQLDILLAIELPVRSTIREMYENASLKIRLAIYSPVKLKINSAVKSKVESKIYSSIDCVVSSSVDALPLHFVLINNIER